MEPKTKRYLIVSAVYLEGSKVMKKSTKILLVGVGVVAAGIIAYVLLKKKDTEVQEKSVEEEKSDGRDSAAVCLSTQEFIKRRKERAARIRKARLDSQTTKASHVAEDTMKSNKKTYD